MAKKKKKDPKTGSVKIRTKTGRIEHVTGKNLKKGDVVLNRKKKGKKKKK